MQLRDINNYYTDKVLKHGPCAAGADWNGLASQQLRFEQLSKITDNNTHFSVNDLGCGYGALLDYFDDTGKTADYLGIDIAPAMIEQATKLHGKHTTCRFITGSAPDRVADYTMASGIFNVRLSTSDEVWQSHMAQTLDSMRQSSLKGFAFNCLTSYSDQSHMRDYLYYANPGQWFDFCKTRYSRNVALLHDYELYEFTLMVRL